MKRAVIIFFMIFGLSVTNAYPYWIWSPKTGKWINPKTAAKPSPKEQFDLAKNLFELKKYEEAKREFKKILHIYPKSVEASEAQYYLALVEEANNNLYEAYLAYQKVIDKYPFSERINEIVEREYKIGESFMSGEKRKALGLSLPVENPAIEIFTKVIENSSFGPLAAKAQYKLGLVYKSLSRLYEAESAFEKVVSNYPGSEWVTAAKYQIASCRAAVSKGPDYDQGATKEAMEKFEAFTREHPEAILSEDAEKNIQQLKEKEAESNYSIAQFYEKQKAFDSAKIYYSEIVDKNPKSSWAVKAFERLRILEARRNGPDKKKK
jgi:outer membrane protein assembly factor BamD